LFDADGREQVGLVPALTVIDTVGDHTIVVSGVDPADAEGRRRTRWRPR
jgi:hypothetical protein